MSNVLHTFGDILHDAGFCHVEKSSLMVPSIVVVQMISPTAMMELISRIWIPRPQFGL